MWESSTLLRSLRQTAGEMAAVLPDVGLAALLLVIGWLLAKLVRRVAIRVLRLMQVDRLAERSGIDDFLVRAASR